MTQTKQKCGFKHSVKACVTQGNTCPSRACYHATQNILEKCCDKLQRGGGGSGGGNSSGGGGGGGGSSSSRAHRVNGATESVGWDTLHAVMSARRANLGDGLKVE